MSDPEFDESWLDDGDEPPRRHSPVVQVVALVLVAAMVLSAAWVLIVMLSSGS